MDRERLPEARAHRERGRLYRDMGRYEEAEARRARVNILTFGPSKVVFWGIDWLNDIRLR